MFGFQCLYKCMIILTLLVPVFIFRVILVDFAFVLHFQVALFTFLIFSFESKRSGSPDAPKSLKFKSLVQSQKVECWKPPLRVGTVHMCKCVCTCVRVHVCMCLQLQVLHLCDNKYYLITISNITKLTTIRIKILKLSKNVNLY